MSIYSDFDRCQLESALTACGILIAAFTKGKENGGSVDWDELEEAYREARRALRTNEGNEWKEK